MVQAIDLSSARIRPCRLCCNVLLQKLEESTTCTLHKNILHSYELDQSVQYYEVDARAKRDFPLAHNIKHLFYFAATPYAAGCTKLIGTTQSINLE